MTGAGSRIGAAIAGTLADEGCAVLVHGRDAAAAAAVAEQIAARGVRTEVVLGDLTEPGVAEEVAVTARDFGARILVNNAGPFAGGDWGGTGPADWHTAFEGDVLPTVRVTQTLLPSLRQHGWGRVITVGHRAAGTAPPAAARAAMVNMTTSLAHHLAGTGVTANCVSPGVIVADEERIDGSAGERPGRPADIAAAVVYLASPLADYVNGIELRVDGGYPETP